MGGRFRESVGTVWHHIHLAVLIGLLGTFHMVTSSYGVFVAIDNHHLTLVFGHLVEDVVAHQLVVVVMRQFHAHHLYTFF